MADPYRYFRIEARELIEGLSRGVIDLERNGSSPERVAKLLRHAHTLKGASRVVRQTAIADVAHAIEDALSPHREFTGEMPATAVNELLRMIDAITRALGLLDAAPAAVQATVVPEEAADSVRADVADLDQLLEVATEASVRLAALGDHVAELGHAERLARTLAGLVGARTSDAAQTARLRGVAEDLNAVLGRLVRAVPGMADALRADVHGIRDAAQRLRLMPAASLEATLERAARDAAAALGRNVELTLSAGRQRLDAHILAALRDALLHTVRNAVAHGIEAPDERRAAGKRPTGRVDVTLERRGRRVVVSCRDDGRGIDPIAVRRAAVARGTVTATAAESMSAEEALRLILAPGVSTSAAVTAVSGRGVGLDVVRDTVARLGGEVNVASTAGQGTTIEISVPATVSSIPALMVDVDGSIVMLPLDVVRHTVRVVDTDVARSPERDAIECDGEWIPYLPLAHALRRPEGIRRHGTRATAIVLEAHGENAAFAVDALIGTADVVIHPVPVALADATIVAGTSLDAEGNVLLLLDGRALIRLARSERSRIESPPARPHPILVIDDSLTTRMLEQSILESAGYTVDVATSGEEALQRAQQNPYGLFLVDVEMPGMDGFEFVSRTRADATLRSVPAILVTSRDSPDDRRRGRDAGASAYIVKSDFDQNVLLATIKKLTG